MRYFVGLVCVLTLGVMPLAGTDCGWRAFEYPCTEQGIRDAIAESEGPWAIIYCEEPTRVVIQAEIEIDNNVALEGGGTLTVDGDDRHRVFSVREGVRAELSGFTVTGGFREGGPSSSDNGAAIANRGKLILRDSMVSGNRCGMFCSYAISNDAGDVEIRNSTISRNAAGGIGNAGGTLTLVNSTVSETEGAIHMHAGTLTVRHSTLSGSVSAIQGELSWDNTLIAGACSIDWLQTEVTSRGYNIESPNDTCGLDQGTDRARVSAEDVKLEPLADNGGLTETHALGVGNVAIDAIPAVDCGATTDQRGKPRPETGGTMCDVGAFEVQPED